MNDIKFVDNIINEVIKGKSSYYIDTLKSLNNKEIKDTDWLKIKKLYDSLNNSQKEELKSLINLITVNTVSSIFSKLDNISSFANQEGLFELRSNGKIINGDLLDLFWERLEEK
ncbi:MULTISPECIES: hypothetical protein [unclassified Gilliamella]|uniref:hypothetical protein n=1 Tax=unclassified Gilliamella TaxID=2685620 RepID=UPI001309C27D|nr:MULTISPECIES: hypothetical protein [unclassified Gilliamella]MWP50267.1 hypothetical protein [Gilliamella sp. Lep-s35]MWP69613.1 hypothetical protein [Gilliamella sp. Lep-s5]MWP77896.1 hypothetical protein [Gilliamella sp. Lep-s21]